MQGLTSQKLDVLADDGCEAKYMIVPIKIGSFFRSLYLRQKMVYCCYRIIHEMHKLLVRTTIVTGPKSSLSLMVPFNKRFCYTTSDTNKMIKSLS
jgi:hypothetical protein